MFVRPEQVYFDEIEEFDDIPVRGTGGFGSTNK